MAVDFDNVTPLIDQSSTGNTFSHTVNGSSNTAIVVFVVSNNQDVGDLATVTYNSASCPFIGKHLSVSQYCVAAFGTTNVAQGAHTVSVSFGATTVTAWDAVAISFTGVDQTGGATTFTGLQGADTLGASSASITLTVTSTTGDMIVDGTISIANDPSTSSPGTQRWTNNTGSSNTQGATTPGASPSVAVTENLTGTNEGFGMIAFNVVQAGGSTTPITVNNLPIDSLAGGEIV